MRPYRHYCAVASALDIVGDRWSLLIVRELLARGPSRYTDLQHGLPGIATNLLAGRLRELERDGVIRRVKTPPPAPVTLVRLTPRGEALRPVLHALARWGAPLLDDAPSGAAFRSHWLTFPAEAMLRDRKPDRGPATIELRTGDEPVTLRVDGTVTARPGSAGRPDVIVTGSREAMLGVLTGRTDPENARSGGLRVDGDGKVLRRIRA